jgi:RND family efflux transporter MFP subunit
MKRLLKSAVSVLILGVALFLVWHFEFRVESANPNQGTDDKRLTVDLEKVRRQSSYTLQREYVGQVEASLHSRVGFERSGRLERLNVEEGDTVTAGDKLAVMDRERLKAREDVLEATVQESRARLQQARLRKEKIEKGFESDAVAEQEWDQVRTEYNARLAGYKRAQAELRRVRVDLRKSVLEAPFDARVVRRRFDRGAVVDVGTPVFELIEENSYEIRVGITRESLDGFTVGRTGPVYVEGTRFEGTVQSINPTQSTRTRTVDVVFRLNSPDTIVRPGQTALVKTRESVNQSGFWLPISALVEAERGLWACYVVVPGDSPNMYSVEKRRITIEHETSERAYVTGTLSDGDRIVVSGVNRLVNGQKVKLERTTP